jgi:hypothetical protein
MWPAVLTTKDTKIQTDMTHITVSTAPGISVTVTATGR